MSVEAFIDLQGLFLMQQKYILDLLKRTNMVGAKPVTSPMFSSVTHSPYSGEAFSDPSLYLSVSSSLQYLSLTRPNLSFAVNKVCQFRH